MLSCFLGRGPEEVNREELSEGCSELTREWSIFSTPPMRNPPPSPKPVYFVQPKE